MSRSIYDDQLKKKVLKLHERVFASVSLPNIFRMKIGIKILAFLIIVVQAFCACPPKWQQHDSGCFLVVNEKKTWLEANKDCSVRHHGGHLIYLKSSQYYHPYYYQMYLRSPVLNISQPSEEFLLGARKNSSGWFWGNGIRMNSPFRSYSQDETFLKGTYATYLGYSIFKIKSVDGFSKYKYICEVDAGFHQTAYDYSSVFLYEQTSSIGMVRSWNIFSSSSSKVRLQIANSKSTSQFSNLATVSFFPLNVWSLRLTLTPSCLAPIFSLPPLSLSSSSSSSSLSQLLASASTSKVLFLQTLSALSASPSLLPTPSLPTVSSQQSSPSSSPSLLPPPSLSTISSQQTSTSSSQYLLPTSSFATTSSIILPSPLLPTISPQPSSSSPCNCLLQSASLAKVSSLQPSSYMSPATYYTSPLYSTLSSKFSSTSLSSSSFLTTTVMSSSKLLARTLSFQTVMKTDIIHKPSSSLIIKTFSSNRSNGLAVTYSNMILEQTNTYSTDATVSTKKLPVHTLSSSGLDMKIKSFIKNITNLDFKQSSSLNKSLTMMENLLFKMMTDSSTDSINQNPLIASQILEEFAFRYIEYNWNGTKFHIRRENIVLQAEKVYPGNADFTFQMADTGKQESSITLPKENFDAKGTFILSIAYNNLNSLMDAKSYSLGNDSFGYKLKSKIISMSIKPKRKTLVKNVTMALKAAVDSQSEKECVFWRFPSEQQRNAGWSRDGCTVTTVTDKHVDCSCNHLTSFAVLMRIRNKKVSRDQDAILTILTKFGLGLSIVGCVITFFAYWIFTEVKSEQSQIRMNLVFVLAVAHILFLLGTAARFHLYVCVSVAVMLQFFYTSALCWMFAEGIQLYMQVIKVFNTNLKLRQVYGFAWGFPLLLIIVSLSIAGNGSGGIASFVNDDFCWLSVENHLIWTFIAPVLLLILGNLVVLGMVLKEMTRINKPNGDNHGDNSLRSNVKALVVLAPLLGVTWLMGLLCIMGADVVGLYIFTILNSIQGFLIFVFHCWRNSEIQGKFRRKIQALDENRSKHAHEDSNHIHRYANRVNVMKTNIKKKPTIKSNRPKARKQSPGGITISDFDPADFHDEMLKTSTKF